MHELKGCSLAADGGAAGVWLREVATNLHELKGCSLAADGGAARCVANGRVATN
ncbi:MAG: hypothetical protein R2828_05320 [Saprospiraceae bacterium]